MLICFAAHPIVFMLTNWRSITKGVGKGVSIRRYL
jgi:hypothetical protein